MKKLCAWLLLACLLLGGCARAEEAAQAALAKAFGQKVVSLLSGTGPDKALHFSLSLPDQQEWLASLRMAEEGRGVLELSLQIPGQAQPVIVQTDRKTLWLSFQEQVYALPVASLPAALQAFLLRDSLSGDAMQALPDMAQLFFREVLQPGVTLRAEADGTLVLEVDLSAGQVIDGLIRFGDAAADNEAYGEILSALGQAAGSGGGFAAWWPQLRRELQDTVSDARLLIDARLKAESALCFSLRAEAAFSMAGAAINLSAGCAGDAAGIRADAKLTETWKETPEEYLLRFSAEYSRPGGHVNACLTLPMAAAEYRLAGTLRSGSLQGSLTSSRAGIPGPSAEVNVLTTDDSLSASADIHPGYWSYGARYGRLARSGAQSLSLSLFLSPQALRLDVSDGTETYRLETSLTGGRGLEASPRLEAAVSSFRYGIPVADAKLTASRERDDLVVSAGFGPSGQPESSRGKLELRVNSDGTFTGSYAFGQDSAGLRGCAREDSLWLELTGPDGSLALTALWDEESGSVNGQLIQSNGSTWSFRGLWSPRSFSAVLDGSGGRRSLLLQLDPAGGISLLRVENGWQWSLNADRSGILLTTPDRRVQISSRFESDARHVLTAETNPTRYVFSSRLRQVTELKTELTEDAAHGNWRLESRLTLPGGARSWTAALYADSPGAFVPLRGKETGTVDFRLLSQLAAALAPPAQEAAPAGEPADE